MASNLYKNTNSINIDTFQVFDYILKYNSVSFIELEIISNIDFEQIINKSISLNFSLVNTSDNSKVYASFNPSISDFNNTKNSINIGSSTYNRFINYFLLKPAINNFFDNNNTILTTNNPLINTDVSLQITIDGNSQIYNTSRKIYPYNNLNTTYPTTFRYMQKYDLSLNGFYIQPSDLTVIKISGGDASTASMININNFVNNPVRDINYDFVYQNSGKAYFSGTNSYTLIKNYSLYINQSTSLFLRKIGQPDLVLKSSNLFSDMEIGCTKLFNKTLKNTTSVSDTLYLEIPLFKNLNGVNISSINFFRLSPKVVFNSSPVITSLGNGKFKIDLSYAPTGEPLNTVASYNVDIALSFIHPNFGSLTFIGYNFIYTNSNG